MKNLNNTPDPENENQTNEDETLLDETGAEHIGSNNTDENSEGRKEGKSFYEKLREVEEDKDTKNKQA